MIHDTDLPARLHPSRRFNRIGAVAMLLAGLCAMAAVPAAMAQAYPSKPIRLIHPYPPGASTDTTSRTIAPLLATRLGQPIVIDNRGGADSSIGLALAVRAG